MAVAASAAECTRAVSSRLFDSACASRAAMHIRQLTASIVRLPLKLRFTHATATRRRERECLRPLRARRRHGRLGRGCAAELCHRRDAGRLPRAIGRDARGGATGGRLQFVAGRDSAVRAISAGGDPRQSARLLWQRAAMCRRAEHSRCVRPRVWRAGECGDAAFRAGGGDSCRQLRSCITAR